MRSTSQRLYPNYANVDWSGNAGYDRNDPRTYFSTMGCRTANGYDINGLGQAQGRPRQYLSHDHHHADARHGGRPRRGEVHEALDQKIHEAKDTLIERFDWICSQDPKTAPFMWDNNTMAGYIPEEGIRSAMKHGTLAIGQARPRRDTGSAHRHQPDHTPWHGTGQAHRTTIPEAVQGVQGEVQTQLRRLLHARREPLLHRHAEVPCQVRQDQERL